jgi:hypothetical protein
VKERERSQIREREREIDRYIWESRQEHRDSERKRESRAS